MHEGSSVRMRPAIDRIALIFIAACLGIALVRLAVVVVAIPYVVYTNYRQGAVPKDADAEGGSLLSGLRKSRPAVSWWGMRQVPYPGSDTYLEATEHHNPARTIGSVIGVVAEQERKKGVLFKRALVPVDRTRLNGAPPGGLLTSADGTQNRTTWRSLASDSRAFSDVQVYRKYYDPLLTPAQNAGIASKTRLRQLGHEIFVGTARPGDSGKWILFARLRGTDREFLIVPIESTHLAGVL